MKLLIFLILSYLLGSIPFAYIISKKLFQIDIRKKGSGNVGATNVLRVAGFLPGLFVLLLDLLKGFLAVKLSGLYFPDLVYLAGLLAIVGHCWSIFLKFSGGKGVATTLGVLLGLNPIYLVYVLACWIIVFLLFKIVSLASLAAAGVLPLILSLRGEPPLSVSFIGLYSAIIILRHKNNIGRLLRGEEKKISLFRKK